MMTLEEFRAYAKNYNVIPVSQKFIADSETPLGLYRKLANERPGTFLLESAEHGGVWSRYSFIGVNSVATLTERDGKAEWVGTPPAGAPSGLIHSRLFAFHPPTFDLRIFLSSVHSLVVLSDIWVTRSSGDWKKFQIFLAVM
jgi:hypothetical protein